MCTENDVRPLLYLYFTYTRSTGLISLETRLNELSKKRMNQLEWRSFMNVIA